MARVHVDRELRDGRGVRPGVCVRGAAVGWRRGRDGAEEGEGARGREWNNARGEERETRGSCCFFCNLSFSERLKALFREVPGRRGGRQGGVGGAAVREGARSREAERGGSKIFFSSRGLSFLTQFPFFYAASASAAPSFPLQKVGRFFVFSSLSLFLCLTAGVLCWLKGSASRADLGQRGAESACKGRRRGGIDDTLMFARCARLKRLVSPAWSLAPLALSFALL